jgi:hypothetical protein
MALLLARVAHLLAPLAFLLARVAHLLARLAFLLGPTAHLPPGPAFFPTLPAPAWPISASPPHPSGLPD